MNPRDFLILLALCGVVIGASQFGSYLGRRNRRRHWRKVRERLEEATPTCYFCDANPATTVSKLKKLPMCRSCFRLAEALDSISPNRTQPQS